LFNYDAAVRLVRALHMVKVLAMVLTIVGTVIAAFSLAVATGQADGTDGRATLYFILTLLGGAIVTAIVWAQIGWLQHMLAATATTARESQNRLLDRD
jgi:hypothetical protein